MDFPEPVKHVVDGVSLVNVGLIVTHVISDLTIWLSFVWVLLRVYETDTVQRMLGRKPNKEVQSLIEEDKP